MFQKPALDALFDELDNRYAGTSDYDQLLRDAHLGIALSDAGREYESQVDDPCSYADRHSQDHRLASPDTKHHPTPSSPLTHQTFALPPGKLPLSLIRTPSAGDESARRKSYYRPNRQLHHPIRSRLHNGICAVQLSIALNVTEPDQQAETRPRYTRQSQVSSEKLDPRPIQRPLTPTR